MRQSFSNNLWLFLVLSLLSWLISSCVSKDDLDELRGRIDAIENTQIASVNSQITSITSSIGEMKQIETNLKSYIDNLQESKTQLENSLIAVQNKIETIKAELQTEVSDSKLETLEALEALKTNLEGQIAGLSTTISTIQDKSTELEVRIKSLETYVSEDLKKTQDWAKATFSTLEQFNETSEAIAGIKVDIDAINKSLTSLDVALNAKIDDSIAETLKSLRDDLKKEKDSLTNAIDSLETNMKRWVNQQLTNYYTIAELDARFEQLQTQYKDADKELKAEIEAAMTALEKQKKEITDAYKKAIASAIENNNGSITKVIQDEIKTVNDRITSVVDEITIKFTSIEKRLSGIEQQISDILAMIQSVIVIPNYSNGSVSMSNTDCKIRFEVLPLSAAEKLANIDPSAFSIKVVSTIQTKATSDEGGILLPVKSVRYENEEVIIETNGESLPATFFKGIEGASCRLKISDGANNVSSSYFSLSPDNTAGGFFFGIQDLSGVLYEPFLIEDNIIHVSVPKGLNLNALYPIITGNDIYMSSYGFEIKGKQAFDFSDFTKPFKFKQYTKDGVQNEWTVNLYDLPVLVMDTPDKQPITSKEVRVEGTEMKIIQGNTVTPLGTAGVKGRGNSTWSMPKKPYNVKLDKKKEILGMAKSKHWVLLSNPYYDQTQLHNDVAFEIARMTDYPWVQSGRFIELVLNGKHQGLYYICEKVRIETGKIDIYEIKSTDISGDNLTGGYMLEADVIKKENYYFSTDFYNKTGRDFAYPLVWNVSKPEDDVAQEQIDYIKNFFNYTESLIANDATLLNGDYRSYLDIESAINWWLVENLCTNEEASRTKNLIVYKDRDSGINGGKLTIGPTWDLDAWTFDKRYYKVLFVNTNTWLYHRLLIDPYFVARLKEKWNSYYANWKDKIPQYINQQYDLIHKSALRNKILWPDWYFNEKSYEEYIEEMQTTFMSQLEWMNTYINNM